MADDSILEDLKKIAPVSPGGMAPTGRLGFAPDPTPLPEDQYDPKKLSLAETYRLTMGEDGTMQSAYRTATVNSFAPDDNWKMPEFGTEEFKTLTDGIPEEQQDRIYGARSQAEASWLAHEIREENATEQLLYERGAWGIAGRFAMGMTDPVAFTLGVATGGLGVAAKAARLAKTAAQLERAGKMAEAGAAIERASALTKATSAGKIALQRGGIAAGENAALSEVNTAGTPTRDQWDVVHSALLGFTLGAGASRIFSGRELNAIRTSIEQTRAKVNFAELSDYIDTRRAEILDQMAHAPTETALKQAQDDLAALQAEVQTRAQARQDDLMSRAAPGPNDKALRKAAKAKKQAQDEVNGADAQLERIRDKLLAEDIAIHGEAAHSPALAKLREKVAQRDWKAGKDSAQTRLDRATEEYDRLLDAQSARGQLNDVLRSQKESPDDFFDRLAHPDQADLAPKLEAANKAVADAEKAHKAAMDAHEADLTKLTQLQEQGSSRMWSMDSAEAADTASAFGPDSASAARFMGIYESVNPEFEYPSGLPMAKQKLAWAGRAVGTITSKLRGHDNAVVRSELGVLVGDPTGTVDGSTSSFGASEIAKRIAKTYWTKFNKAVTESYDKWIAEQGISRIHKFDRDVRERFMSDVGLHIRGQESENVHVKKAGDQIAQLFSQFVKDAKEAGVKGFENVEPNLHYLPRVFNFHALERIEKQIGTPNVRMLFAKAIQKANPELDDKLAARIAHYYVKRMKELRVGDDAGLLNGMRFDDIGFLRQFLKEAGADPDDINEIAQKFVEVKKGQGKNPEEGNFRNAKHRVQYDENFEMEFRDEHLRAAGKDGNVKIKISDLLENNVEALFGRYQRAMSGHIGLAKVGIKDRAEFEARLGRVEGALEGDVNELKKVKEVANLVYDLITGRPVEDANTLTRWGRLVRDWNYASTMNAAGFSQVPDWAALLSSGYLRYTMRYLPEVVSTVRRLRNGEIVDREMNMLQDWSGLGTDSYNNSIFSAYDDPENRAGFSGFVGKVEHGLRVAGRYTTKISGLGFMNDVATRLAAKAVLARLTDEVRNGGAISSKRLAQIGLDQKMLARIKKQINGTSKNVDADFVGKQRILDFAKWTDIEARDAMLNGIFREARRMVQDEDLGETAPWMHNTFGKMILQFRRFMMVSYTKQILHGVAMHDAEAATTLMVGTALAALSYEVQFRLKWAAMPDGKEKDAFEKKYLSGKAVALAAWSRGNYSSFFPALSDTLTGQLLGVKNFDTRASRLGSGLFDGNPTVNTLNALGTAAGSLVAPVVRKDRQFTKSDANAWKHLAPFGNFIGADIPFNAMTKDLPRTNKDSDPDKVDWIF